MFIASLFTEFGFRQIQTLHTENKTAERWVYCKSFSLQAEKFKATGTALSCSQNEEFLWDTRGTFLADWLPQVLRPHRDADSWVRAVRKSRDKVHRLGIWGPACILCGLLRSSVNSWNLCQVSLSFIFFKAPALDNLGEVMFPSL